MSKASRKEIAKLIKDTRKEIDDFEKSIKNAPREAKGEYKVYVRKQRTKLRQLEDTFKAGE